MLSLKTFARAYLEGSAKTKNINIDLPMRIQIVNEAIQIEPANRQNVMNYINGELEDHAQK